ncbi:melatonin receptor type 1C-like [Protopterus annectens]|uniref:melatonin receptor type 1C-like n=1 Tax=Protopterus annectens TaxID=7888 RepID=UPI001CFAD3B5|nr:melatonin receptor type 1C-like [Protopterus annectens]
MNDNFTESWQIGTNCSKLISHPSKAVTTLQAIVMIITTLTDIFGNILVILSILQNKKLRNPGNIFVISLAVADLMVALHPYPLLVVALLQKQWTMGMLQCQLAAIIQGLSFIGSILNITAIAINRYCCICHSQVYDKLYSMKNTYYLVIWTWTLSIALVLPMILEGALQYDPRVYSCTFVFTTNLSFTSVLAVLHFIIPLTTVIYCYTRIWILVIQVKYRVRQENKQKVKASEVRNFFTMFAAFVLFAVCWGPYSISALILSFNPDRKSPIISDELFVVGFFMAYFNSCLNGIAYGIFNPNFRQQYKNVVLSLCSLIARNLQTF